MTKKEFLAIPDGTLYYLACVSVHKNLIVYATVGKHKMNREAAGRNQWNPEYVFLTELGAHNSNNNRLRALRDRCESAMT